MGGLGHEMLQPGLSPARATLRWPYAAHEHPYPCPFFVNFLFFTRSREVKLDPYPSSLRIPRERKRPHFHGSRQPLPKERGSVCIHPNWLGKASGMKLIIHLGAHEMNMWGLQGHAYGFNRGRFFTPIYTGCFLVFVKHAHSYLHKFTHVKYKIGVKKTHLASFL